MQRVPQELRGRKQRDWFKEEGILGTHHHRDRQWYVAKRRLVAAETMQVREVEHSLMSDQVHVVWMSLAGTERDSERETGSPASKT